MQHATITHHTKREATRETPQMHHHQRTSRGTPKRADSMDLTQDSETWYPDPSTDTIMLFNTHTPVATMEEKLGTKDD